MDRSRLFSVTRLVLGILFLPPVVVVAAEIGVPAELDRKADGVIDLLKKNLDAWQVEDLGEISNWKFRGGAIINDKLGPNLLTKDKYRNFDLQLEFNLPKGGNSGVYLRGRYEVQLYDEDRNSDPLVRTGAVWRQIPAGRKSYRGANTWNELRVRIVDNSVTILVNRVVYARSTELRGTTPGALDQDENEPGPVLLQSLDGARFRNVLIKPL